METVDIYHRDNIEEDRTRFDECSMNSLLPYGFYCTGTAYPISRTFNTLIRTERLRTEAIFLNLYKEHGKKIIEVIADLITMDYIHSSF